MRKNKVWLCKATRPCLTLTLPNACHWDKPTWPVRHWASSQEKCESRQSTKISTILIGHIVLHFGNLIQLFSPINNAQVSGHSVCCNHTNSFGKLSIYTLLPKFFTHCFRSLNSSINMFTIILWYCPLALALSNRVFTSIGGYQGLQNHKNSLQAT